MKKILFVALGATLLAAGCQKTEIINQVNPDGKSAMTFSTGISKLTKSATATGTENLQDQGFVLSVFTAYDDVPNGVKFNDNYDELNNKLWSYETDWTISTGKSYFWPGKGRDLVFFALSSAQNTDKDKLTYPVSNITLKKEEDVVNVSGFQIAKYTVVPPTYVKEEGDTYGNQTGADDDLMVADVVIQNQDETPLGGEKGRVDLFFNHTLSKVEFVFSTKSETAAKYPVTLNSIIIKDVVTKADLNVGVDLTNRIAENEYVWGTHTEEDDKAYVVEADAADKAEYKVDYDLALDASEKTYSTWLVIPQDLTNKQVSITYTITDASNQNEGNKPTTFTSVWPLAVEGVVDAWEINNYVKYKVTLAPNIITFNPTVENDWNPVVSVDPSTGTEVEDTPAPVEPTYTELKATSGETEVILYYEGTLAVDTVILVKNENVYIPAAEGDYLLENGSTLKVGADGKVTEIVPPTPAN
jgi:hypothetical protein